MRIFLKISDRDKIALMALAAFFVAVLLYSGLRASYSYRTEAAAAFRDSRLLLIDLYTYGRKIRTLESFGKSRVNAGQDQTLLTLVNASAKERSITFKRFQPDGDSSLQLWLEDVNFNAVLWWLTKIENNNGIRVAQISVERTKRDGFVNARITLVR